jgi:hypothetical protein
LPINVREARGLIGKNGRRRRGPGTINRYLSALRSAWNWGRASGIIPQERSWPDRVRPSF